MTVCPRCVLDAPVCLCLLDCGRHEDCAGKQAGEPLRVHVEDGEVLLTRRLGTGTATDHLTPAQALNLCRSLTAAALEVLLGPPEQADEPETQSLFDPDEQPEPTLLDPPERADEQARR